MAPETGHRRDRKLYKDPTDRKIAGVASGVAKYLDLDTTLVRAAWVGLCFVAGFGIVTYVLLWWMLDEEPPSGREPAAAATAVREHVGDVSMGGWDAPWQSDRAPIDDNSETGL